MVDTVKTLAALQTQFADNTTGAISPQDLRDFLVSASPAYGSMYVSTPLETSIADGNFTKAAGTTTSVSLTRFDMPADNRLRYVGTPDCHFHGVISFSMSIASGSNKVLELGAYIYDDSAASGAVLAHSVISRNAASTAVGTGALHFDVMLSTNDYIELHVKNTTDTTSITVNNAYVFAMSMIT